MASISLPCNSLLRGNDILDDFFKDFKLCVLNKQKTKIKERLSSEKEKQRKIVTNLIYSR